MNGAKVLALVAAGGFLAMAAPAQYAQAASLINPGAAEAVQHDAKQDLTSEVRWHWHHNHGWHHHYGWRHWHHRHW